MTKIDRKPLLALGLMSGTSLDGIDGALLTTDGVTVSATGQAVTVAYDAPLRERLRAVLGREGEDAETSALDRDLALAHAKVVEQLLAQASIAAGDVDLIGFHGHTILHRPAAGITRQLGDGRLLARAVGIPVVSRFRTADVAAGGQGAPLAPLYHGALAASLPKPIAVLNLGGVGNVTWIGADGRLLAFDTGPGNALIDDWMRRNSGQPFDADGACAARGQPIAECVQALLSDPYFDRPPPKSLDREDFQMPDLDGASLEDGAATLSVATVAAVAAARRYFPAPAKRWLVTGGGRHNGFLMRSLAEIIDEPLEPVEVAGWSGDALEAQAFAFLAVRSFYGLPLSVPGTTGVPQPTVGGHFDLPPSHM